MKNIIKHVRVWVATILMFPFVVVACLISLLSLVLFSLAMGLIKIPQVIGYLIGPKITPADGKRYKNWLVRFLDYILDKADWPNR